MRWEYKTVKLATEGFLEDKLDEAKLDSLMNQLGNDGWELVVGVCPTELLGGTRDVIVIFKRQQR